MIPRRTINALPRRCGYAASAALTAALLLGASADPAAADQTVPSDYAGYIAHSTTYDSVTSTWTEPTVACGAIDYYAAFWVGLDGYSNSTTEETGTEVDCTSGTARHYAFYELYPAAPVDIAKQVTPGDSMTATVTATTTDQFTLTIRDTTKGWAFTTTKTVSGAARTSAEVILEAPTLGRPTMSVTFSGTYVNGGTLAASKPTRIGNHCGAISTSGTSFTCTW
jgi:Peptidase A4 family